MRSSSGDGVLSGLIKPGDVSFAQGTSCCLTPGAHVPGAALQSGHRPAELWGTWTSSDRELPGRTAKGSHQGPQVQQHTHPTGGHLDPEDGPAPNEEGLNGGVFVVEPAGQSHHHVEGSQEQDKVEIGVAVDGAFLLIVNDPGSLLDILLLFRVFPIWTEAETAPGHLQLRSSVSPLQGIRARPRRRCQT